MNSFFEEGGKGGAHFLVIITSVSPLDLLCCIEMKKVTKMNYVLANATFEKGETLKIHQGLSASRCWNPCLCPYPCPFLFLWL